MFCLEFWFSSLGRLGCLYMELSVFNSRKVTTLHLRKILKFCWIHWIWGIVYFSSYVPVLKSFIIIIKYIGLPFYEACCHKTPCKLLGVRLHQASASALRQLCNDAPEWSCNPFSSDSIDFNENRITSVMAELFGVNEQIIIHVYLQCMQNPSLSKFYEGVGLNCKASLCLSAIILNLSSIYFVN